MKKMRKPLSLLLSAVLLISLLAGCGGKPEQGPGSATAQTPGTTQTAEGSQQGTGAADGNAAAGGTESGTAASQAAETGPVELSPEATAGTENGVTVDVGEFVLDGPATLSVTRQADEENAEEGYKIESYDIAIGDLSELDDFITIRIPYDDTYCEAGQDPARCVGAKYLNEETGAWEDVLFEVDAQAKELVIYTDHLSIYGAFHVTDEAKRNAYISDVMEYNVTMDPDKVIDFGKRIAADDPTVKDDLVDEVASTVFDWTDRVDNAFNIAFLGEVPDYLSPTIPDTNMSLFTAVGYFATCYNLLTIAAKDSQGQAEDAEILNLIRDVSTKMITFAADSFTKLGSGALSVWMGGVLIIEKMLMAFGQQMQETRIEDIEFVYHHYNEGFSATWAHKLMRPKDWRALVIEVLEKNPDNPDLAISTLEAGFNKYASEFFALSADQMAEVAADVPNVDIKRIPNFTEAEKDQMITNYVNHLKNNTMPAVLTSVRNYMIKKAEQQQLDALYKIRDFYNSKIQITMTEEIPAGQSSQFAGYKFRFAPLVENAPKNNWTGLWPESGSVKASATLMGFATAGYPHTVEFFKPDADLEKDKPEFTVPFVIDIPEINITVTAKEPLTIDAFMGEWVDEEGSRLILSFDGDHVIAKEPDLSWYGGDVVVAEYEVSYDAATQTLSLNGLTSWVISPDKLEDTSYSDRPLEVSIAGSGNDYTALETKDGIVTEMTTGWVNFTRN